MAIIKKSYSEQIYEDLKNDILCNRIEFGEKLANRELQKRFEVSSTPIRDAINHLYLEGFIEEITKVGARVVSFNLQSALEINEIVSMLSVNAIRLSSEKSSCEEVTHELEKQLALQKEHCNGDGYYQYDDNFHKVFFQYALNGRLTKLYDQYNVLQEILIRYYYKSSHAEKHASIEEHEAICAAYKQADFVQAQNKMAQHYLNAAEYLKQVLR